ncbi:hypothetical protein Nepgr_015886 [Nepenthes gracilis]|uniref:Uncharacterized protein n=1 Tax=Nepenthes gracilis TaxID=150966 RepID=A0AAD3SLP3_NEPGR|nr:hypothetical protein Nepgr_015886 [Nepenthes gracilis]
MNAGQDILCVVHETYVGAVPAGSGMMTLACSSSCMLGWRMTRVLRMLIEDCCCRHSYALLSKVWAWCQGLQCDLPCYIVLRLVACAWCCSAEECFG